MKYLLGIIILFLVSCTTVLEENAKTIQLVSLEQKNNLNCTYLGVVFGGSFTGWDLGDDLRNATNEMLNNASDKGANAVYLITSETNLGGGSVSGEALKCRGI